MDKKSLEKDYSSDDEPSKSLYEKIYGVIRSNWLALLFALIIAIITIVVIPIVYSIDRTASKGNEKDLAWNVTGKTYVNQSNILIDSTNNSFGLISSIEFDSNNNLYILDKTKHRILIFDNTQSLILFAGYLNGTNGSDSKSFNSPNDIYIHFDNNIYIADTFNHRIQLFKNDSSKQGTTICGTGISGQLPNLNQPMSLTLDNNSFIYIADYGNNQIVQCNTRTNELTILIPSTGIDRSTYVNTPISIKYHFQTNSLVIAQEMGFNVIRWYLGSSLKSWILIAGSASSELSGTSRTLFNQLCSVNIDAVPDVLDTYVVDCNNQRIQFYQGDLTKGRTIAGVINAQGNNTFLFNHPTDIAFDKLMNLYVADSNNGRIQRFPQLIDFS